MNAVTTLSVPGIHCAGCISKIERELGRTEGVLEARVNFTSKRVRVSHVEGVEAEALRHELERIGFVAHPFLGEVEGEANRESRDLVKCLAVAGFASMNVMLLSVSVWSGAEGATRQLFHWLSALIAFPTIAYAGRPFFRSAWGAIRHGRTNMDVPIAIGIAVICVSSLYEVLTWGPHAYFDGAVMLLFFLLAGRVLDSVMRARAQDGVAALLRQTPPGGFVLGPEGSRRWRAAEELAPGMRLLVAAGERLAADGTVEVGTSSVDRSLVTGESVPDQVTVGSAVLAGTINLDAPLTVKVTAAGENTAIADIARLMEAAGGAKSRYLRIADRAARIYAPAVHSLAAATFLFWLLTGAGVHQAVTIAVAVLIITCPCALGLAVPVAQVVASGALMRRGILIKDGSALERLAEADIVFFDKTGTLTCGRPALVGTLPLSTEERAVALALASASRHPLAVALAREIDHAGIAPVEVADIREVAGQGVEGFYQGRLARLGRPDWVGAQSPGAAMATAFALAPDTLQILEFSDALRPDARATVDRLRALDLPARILSGDRREVVAAVAGQLDIEGDADLSPQGKFGRIEGLAGQGRKVLMVGDGLNDGPALKAAHVSIAPASASDVGQTAADLLFLGDDLSAIPVAVAAARRTLRVVRQNFTLAIGYNVLAVPLAMAGYVTPLIAALAMSGSSVIVVANALRLRSAAR
ncbi:heavy metal translocating P-type ATPase [Sphingomonas sp. HF-S4]|uniref:Heavy metal translocating P-type ATPase n=1 Tax=Sphingomonas agrestis TaxID=3080540 RepID=A0ABU3Y3M4_9SPHN|nr:heavy metal translocating P-type ATPase [Sphingomonas sp. HF-S4]MDV3456015.1 heavy metal translocating P-type ATPase [Sphingomonas sp. HF-S4]